MKTLSLWVLFYIASANALLHENVFFHEVGSFSMSRSKWIVSFVIDLSTYERFLEKLTYDIDNTTRLVDDLIEFKKIPMMYPTALSYKHSLHGMRGVLTIIKTIHTSIQDSFNDFKILKTESIKPHIDHANRVKRKVLGFVGDLMSDLFGVVTDSDVSSIQRNIRRLFDNQKDITHIVEKSLSVLNVSRIEIQENRQKINDLITVLADLEVEVQNISNILEYKLLHLEQIIGTYSQVDGLVKTIGLALDRSMYFYTQFQLQIQAVAMQRLSPTTIPADLLRRILLGIQDRLPQTVGLPRDPHAYLFDYYKFLKCSPIFDGKHIVISIKIPLVEYSQQFDIFRAYSLPVPLLGRTRLDNENKDLLAYYKLESSHFAISLDRSRYVLLDENQAKQCFTSGMRICNLKSPIRKVNVARSCLLSNFNQDRTKVKQLCEIWIHQSMLPNAHYLSNDVYLIIVKKQTVFHKSCDKQSNSRIQIDPPFGFLKLPKTCKATSDYFSLMGYFEGESNETVSSPATIMIENYNITDIRVWDDISRVLPIGNKTINIPNKLANLEEFPLKKLLGELHSMSGMELMNVKRFPIWGYVVIGMSVIFCVYVLITCICRNKASVLFSKCVCLARKNPKAKKRLMTNQTVSFAKRADDALIEDECVVISDADEKPPRRDDIVKKKFVLLDRISPGGN